jgi:uncharacterized membrane protein YidH (DUF202 family)
MDFKKLASFIILLGVLVFGYGAIKYSANLPRAEVPGFSHEEERESLRSDATKAMIAGGIVIFAGVAIRFSTRTKS